MHLICLKLLHILKARPNKKSAKEKNGITLVVDGNTPYKILYEKNAKQRIKILAVSFLARNFTADDRL